MKYWRNWLHTFEILTINCSVLKWQCQIIMQTPLKYRTKCFGPWVKRLANRRVFTPCVPDSYNIQICTVFRYPTLFFITKKLIQKSYMGSFPLKGERSRLVVEHWTLNCLKLRVLPLLTTFQALSHYVLIISGHFCFILHTLTITRLLCQKISLINNTNFSACRSRHNCPTGFWCTDKIIGSVEE